jgi:hypothetical protein
MPRSGAVFIDTILRLSCSYCRLSAGISCGLFARAQLPVSNHLPVPAAVELTRKSVAPKRLSEGVRLSEALHCVTKFRCSHAIYVRIDEAFGRGCGSISCAVVAVTNSSRRSQPVPSLFVIATTQRHTEDTFVASPHFTIQSYLTENTVCFNLTDESGSVVQGNGRCLL